MFELYRMIATELKVDITGIELDRRLFQKLKKIITELVHVEPKKRMKLAEVREELDKLEPFLAPDYIVLENLINDKTNNDVFQRNTEETSQASHRLMDDIRNTMLFTIPTTGDQMKLTQRLTNLCVSVAAMQLLSHALIEFIKNNCNQEISVKLEREILKYPKNPRSSNNLKRERSNQSSEQPNNDFEDQYGRVKENQPENKKVYFIQQLITICCGVISPRSLNGLNHCNLDDKFQITAQEQNISKFFGNCLV